MKKWMAVVIVVLVVVSGLLYRGYKAERAGRQRAERNVTALTSEMGHYVTANGEMAVKIAGLELSERELKRLLPQLYARVADLDVKLKHALSVTSIETGFEYATRDPIVYVAGGDSLRVFDIDDRWIKARVSVRDCSVIPAGGVEVFDIPNELTAVPVVRYKGWWLWRRAVGVTLDVKCSNPYIKVVNGVFIDLKKKRYGKD